MPNSLDSDTRPSGDPGACARCAERFSTCCVIRPDIAECCFPLSGAEQAAIEEHTGSNSGTVSQANTPLFLKAMRELFPDEPALVASAFPPDSEHRRLAVRTVRGESACAFLGREGCALPRDVRPAYCRIFPFWVRRGEIWHFALRDCQAQREQRSRPALQKAFGLADAEIFALYNTLRHGWGLPPRSRLRPLSDLLRR